MAAAVIVGEEIEMRTSELPVEVEVVTFGQLRYVIQLVEVPRDRSHLT
jgi:hypothetical protein